MGRRGPRSTTTSMLFPHKAKPPARETLDVGVSFFMARIAEGRRPAVLECLKGHHRSVEERADARGQIEKVAARTEAEIGMAKGPGLVKERLSM